MVAKTMDNMTEDFLSSINDSEFLKSNTEEAKPVESETKSVSLSVQPQEQTTDSPPDLMGTDFPSDYITMVDRIKVQYRLLPSLDYDAIYREVAELSIKSSPTPTMEVLMDELHKVQAAKDRLAEILIDVIKCYNFKKRAVDILKDSWGKFTSEKNTEGRKGDATFRLSHFLTDFSRTEALCKACDHIFKNLDGLQDNLSRRITIWQLLLKVREGRMALPDFDFNKETPNSKIDSLFDDQGKSPGSEDEISLKEF